jgi:hypothetical protein
MIVNGAEGMPADIDDLMAGRALWMWEPPHPRLRFHWFDSWDEAEAWVRDQ